MGQRPPDNVYGEVTNALSVNGSLSLQSIVICLTGDALSNQFVHHASICFVNALVFGFLLISLWLDA